MGNRIGFAGHATAVLLVRFTGINGAACRISCDVWRGSDLL